MTYNVVCPRCGGSGRYDRGACFECKGFRYVKRSKKPNMPEHRFVVHYENGTTNYVGMYGGKSSDALAAIEAIVRTKGWAIRKIDHKTVL